jgi:hypothetical protein
MLRLIRDREGVIRDRKGKRRGKDKGQGGEVKIIIRVSLGKGHTLKVKVGTLIITFRLTFHIRFSPSLSLSLPLPLSLSLSSSFFLVFSSSPSFSFSLSLSHPLLNSLSISPTKSQQSLGARWV